MKTEFSIGAVCFGEPSETNSARFRITSHVGEERRRMLQLVRDGKPLPEPFFLIGQSSGMSFRRIDSGEIAWETSGIKPTDKSILMRAALLSAEQFIEAELEQRRNGAAEETQPYIAQPVALLRLIQEALDD